MVTDFFSGSFAQTPREKVDEEMPAAESVAAAMKSRREIEEKKEEEKEGANMMVIQKEGMGSLKPQRMTRFPGASGDWGVVLRFARSISRKSSGLH